LQKNAEALSWLADRGISLETAVNYRLGWNQGEKGKDIYRPRKSWGLPEEMKENGKPKMLWIPVGLVIPYIIDGVICRLRIRRPEGEPRYYVIPGSSMGTMLLGRERRAFVIVESELDAIAVYEGNTYAGAAAMGSASAKPDAETYSVLQESLQILNTLDYDTAGQKQVNWWGENFERCDRWPVPQGKDPGEAIKMGTDLNSWIKAGLPPALTMDDSAAEKKEAGETKSPVIPATAREEKRPLQDFHPSILELRRLLLGNPSVKIINSAARFTVLRNDKYVGGRINELVFRVPESRDYILSHPAEVIDGKNLIYTRGE